jgi:N6-L-threonylcarbamoyladenine synthase
VILAIETSCDDTCAAVLTDDGREALSNVVHTQAEHERYGGVVPEVASRAHLERMDGVILEALDAAGIGLPHVSRVAVTVRPGLIGALLVGLSSAKALAYGLKVPLVPVNHLMGHVAAGYLAEPALEPPFVALIASGGHTALYSVTGGAGNMELLGQTLDDAAGEALDKGARMLGLGFPGGPAISRAAAEALDEAGSGPGRYDFPVALKGKDNLDFSFSGLKTSLLYTLKAMDEGEVPGEVPRLAAAYEAAVVEALTRKLLRAADLRDAETVVVAGGVAANALLRRRLVGECEERGLRLVIPPPDLCTDNAAMIGAASVSVPGVPYPYYLSLNARSV